MSDRAVMLPAHATDPQSSRSHLVPCPCCRREVQGIGEGEKERRAIHVDCMRAQASRLPDNACTVLPIGIRHNRLLAPSEAKMKAQARPAHCMRLTVRRARCLSRPTSRRRTGTLSCTRSSCQAFFLALSILAASTPTSRLPPAPRLGALRHAAEERVIESEVVVPHVQMPRARWPRL